MPKRTTHQHVGEGKTVSREITGVYYGTKRHGKSTMKVRCPFCEEVTEVYLWSFTAIGKSCQCGAMLTQFRHAHKLKETVA